jgi:hypothetical protein
MKNNKDIKETYKYECHSFLPLKGVGKLYCVYCGLVNLNNDPTRWAVKMGCNYKDHVSYRNKMKKGIK